MCDFKEGFILCKCNNPKVVVHNKKSRRNKKKKKQPIEYIWTLYKYLGLSKQMELGRYVFPSNDVGSGFTSDFVLNELNNRNCFDFEYSPNEGDNLIISNAESFDRIEFIFRNKKWVKDHYSPFTDEYRKFDNGKVAKTD